MTLKIDKKKEVINGNETDTLLLTINDAHYRIRRHEGEDALEVGYMVNKYLQPRQSRMAALQELFGKMDPTVFKELQELEKNDPDAHQARMEQLAQDGTFDAETQAKILELMASAWESLDFKKETAMTLRLLEKVSCPLGDLNDKKVLAVWMKGPRLAHLEHLRREVIEHNNFLDMTNALF